MSDFFQNGVITNFHNLTHRSVESLEKEMVRFARKRKMGLILPSLFSELEGPALTKIVDELAKVPYLDEIVIGLDRADRDQFLHAREFFSRLPQRHRILWNDGPRLKAIDAELDKRGCRPTIRAKDATCGFVPVIRWPRIAPAVLHCTTAILLPTNAACWHACFIRWLTPLFSMNSAKGFTHASLTVNSMAAWAACW